MNQLRVDPKPRNGGVLSATVGVQPLRFIDAAVCHYTAPNSGFKLLNFIKNGQKSGKNEFFYKSVRQGEFGVR